jgi:DNA repair protein RadC
VTRSRIASLRLDIHREMVHLPGSYQEIATVFGAWGLNREPQEVLWVVAYDAGMTVRTIIEVGRGGHSRVNLHFPTMLMAVLTAGCERFMLVHNHPDGTVKPSPGDIELTRKAMDAANACGLYLEDHIVLTPTGRWYSMAANKVLLPVDYAQVGTDAASG